MIKKKQKQIKIIYNDILFYYIRYKASKGVKPLYIIRNKINGYIEGNNRSKYLKLVHMDQNKYLLKSTTNYGKKHLLSQYNNSDD